MKNLGMVNMTLATLNNGEIKNVKIKHENDMIYVEILDNNILSSP